MATPAELLAANLHRVFGNRDQASRRQAIEEIYTSDVVFTDPERTVTGWDALESAAAALIDQAPADFVFADDGLSYTDADTAALAWTFGPAGSPVARGIDILSVRDGRIGELRTLLHQ